MRTMPASGRDARADKSARLESVCGVTHRGFESHSLRPAATGPCATHPRWILGAVEIMTPEQVRAFLRAGTRTAKLATTSRDGQPHVTPVWFVLDDDDLLFTTHETSRKGRALRRDPRVSLCVDDEQPPYAFVTVQGSAWIDTDLTELRRWAAAIGGRYMGADRAEEFGQRNGVPGEMLVRVTPTTVIGRHAVTA